MKLLQIGACDGNDHVFDFCKAHKDELDQIILVEPLFDAMQATKKQYQDFDQTMFVMSAVVDHNMPSVPIYVPEENELDKGGHCSMNPYHIVAHGHPGFRKVNVSAIHINDLLDQVGDLDYLFIDTEGQDVPILMAADLEKFKVNNIQFECVHADGPFQMGDSLNRLIDKLINFGYNVRKEGEYDLIAEKL